MQEWVPRGVKFEANIQNSQNTFSISIKLQTPDTYFHLATRRKFQTLYIADLLAISIFILRLRTSEKQKTCKTIKNVKTDSMCLSEIESRKFYGTQNCVYLRVLYVHIIFLYL